MLARACAIAAVIAWAPAQRAAGAGPAVAPVPTLERLLDRARRERWDALAIGERMARFGRALGCARDRSYPLGMAVRGYFTSPYHDEPWIESHLDLRDRNADLSPT